jgi:hypothetical protein
MPKGRNNDPSECGLCGVVYMKASGVQKYCKSCIPGKAAMGRMQRYGLTDPAYRELLQWGGGRCWICDDELSERRTHIDHCHRTGKVRGILCPRCNSQLAGVESSWWRVRAEAYLERFGSDA